MRFRKKPVEIDAIQFDGSKENALVLGRWINGNEWADAGADWDADDEAMRGFWYCPYDGDPGGFVITTLEGDMTASVGDWIIRGVAGEFYPCEPDIFDATYERVETPDA